MGNSCEPPSPFLSPRLQAGDYGPFSGWYDVSGCGSCTSYCFWANRTFVDPGGDPHRSLVSEGHNPWVCVVSGSVTDARTGRDRPKFVFPKAWPRDTQLRCGGSDERIFDSTYLMSNSPVFYFVLFCGMVTFVVRIVLWRFVQRKRSRSPAWCCPAEAAVMGSTFRRRCGCCCYCPTGGCTCCGVRRCDDDDDEDDEDRDGGGGNEALLDLSEGKEADAVRRGALRLSVRHVQNMQLGQSLLKHDALRDDAGDDGDTIEEEAVGETTDPTATFAADMIEIDEGTVCTRVPPRACCCRRCHCPSNLNRCPSCVADSCCVRACRRVSRFPRVRTVLARVHGGLAFGHKVAVTPLVRWVVRWWDPVLEPTLLSIGFLWAMFFTFVSAVSFPETLGVRLPETLDPFTPPCSGVGAHTRCPAGATSFNRYTGGSREKEAARLQQEASPTATAASASTSDAAADSASTFTYIIASDVQYNWYDGESFDLENGPAGCWAKEGSCSHDRAAAATQSAQMRAFSALVGEDRHEALLDDDPTWAWARPDTLLVNGDLTAYFQPAQRDMLKRYLRPASSDDDVSNVEEQQDDDGTALPDELLHMFPSLGNHDYDQGKAYFGNDEWSSTGAAGGYCSSKHGVEYFKSAVGGCHSDMAPRFTRNKIHNYHAPSMSYAWDRGRYHFVQLQYYPEFESKRINVQSSLEWLEMDLRAAFRSGAATIINVHSADQLTVAFDRTIAGKGVVAIFAGHLHRCVGHRCAWPTPISAGSIASGILHSDNATHLAQCLSELRADGSLFPCSKSPTRVAAQRKKYSGNQGFTEVDPAPDAAAPEDEAARRAFRELYTPNIVEAGLAGGERVCVYTGVRDPFRRTGFWLNISQGLRDRENETVPVYWSGSLSFQTFLRVGFNQTHMKIEVMTSHTQCTGKAVDAKADAIEMTPPPVLRYVDTGECNHPRNRSAEWGFHGYSSGDGNQTNWTNATTYGGGMNRSTAWWVKHPPNRKYPVHNYSDFMPPIRNVTQVQHEQGPWETWMLYVPQNVSNRTNTSHVNASFIPRSSSWWRNHTFPNATQNASGSGLGGCSAWYGFRCTENGGCGV